jgi:hypothetical protein
MNVPEEESCGGKFVANGGKGLPKKCHILAPAIVVRIEDDFFALIKLMFSIANSLP